MIVSTNIIVNSNLIDQALQLIPLDKLKFVLNRPTGNFFYDPWVIKEEFKNTVWEEILLTLPESTGEARIICLTPGSCYQSHADIDDRYHLNLIGHYSYLIDLDTNNLHMLTRDNIWYCMDASRNHSAANFGQIDRIQLVVRKLLLKNNLRNSISIKLITENKIEARFLFDENISPWLNLANKDGKISNFYYRDTEVTFDIEKDEIDSIVNILPDDFKLEVV